MALTYVDLVNEALRESGSTLDQLTSGTFVTPSDPREVKRAYHRQRYLENKEPYLERARQQRLRDPEKTREYLKQWGIRTKPARSIELRRKHLDNPAKRMWNSAKVRAKKRGLDFTIAVSDIKIPEVCPILGVPLEVGAERALFNSPTLDRKDNSGGYTPDNIVVISYKANTMKNCASLEELRKFAYWCTTSFGYGSAA